MFDDDHRVAGIYEALKENAKKFSPGMATKSGVMAGVYIQAISAYAPHPNAAKLWMEYLYSDAGQIVWLKGYCHPIRYNDLAKRNVIPADVAAKLPPADLYAKAVFPSLAQIQAGAKTVADQWMTVVGADVK